MSKFDADQDFINQEGQIQKIKWLHRRTGMSLLAAKTLYDGLRHMSDPSSYVTAAEADRAKQLLDSKVRTDSERFEEMKSLQSMYENGEITMHDFIKRTRVVIQ